MMRYFGWLLAGILFLGFVGLAARNLEPVTLRYYLGFAWQAPLVLVLFVAFLFGALGGVAASFAYVFRLRRRLRQCQRQLDGRSPAAAPVVRGAGGAEAAADDM